MTPHHDPHRSTNCEQSARRSTGPFCLRSRRQPCRAPRAAAAARSRGEKLVAPSTRAPCQNGLLDGSEMPCPDSFLLSFYSCWSSPIPTFTMLSPPDGPRRGALCSVSLRGCSRGRATAAFRAFIVFFLEPELLVDPLQRRRRADLLWLALYRAKRLWRVGFQISCCILLVWLAVGLPWWRLLKIW